MNQIVYILRGLSGSGKSQVARDLIGYERAQPVPRNFGVICSADDYFMVDGEYRFDPEKLSEAHDACFMKFKKALDDGVRVVVVDNTNIRKDWYAAYVDECYREGVVFTVLEVNIPSNEAELQDIMDRGSHGVPESTYRRWMEDYER